MIYGGSNGANAILEPSKPLSPDNRCICKKTALANYAQDTPLLPFDQNRLVPVKVGSMTYGVIKKHHIIYKDYDGRVIKEEWLDTGAALNPPSHPNDRPGYRANDWTPTIPTTASADGTYTAAYIRQYTITFIGYGGKELSRTVYDEGATITIPDPETPFDYVFTGWDTPVSTIAQGDATYTGQYRYSPGYVPGEDKPTDGDGHYGRDETMYTMDNMGQVVDPNMIASGDLKPVPQSNIKNGVYTGYIAKLLNVPEGFSWIPTLSDGRKTWWSGPMDGSSIDSKYGSDNGIAATRADISGTGRTIKEGMQLYEGDSCIYEYASVDKSTLPKTSADITREDMVSSFTCSCYNKSGEYIGDFKITSNEDWIRFAVGQWNEDPSDYDGLTCPFYVYYFIGDNESSTPRVGTVTVETPGGVCNYNVGNRNPNKNLPYIKSAHVFFYQQGKE